MSNWDQTNIDIDPALIPIQAAQAQVQQQQIAVVAGAVRSIGGLFGPDIVFAAAANSLSFSYGGNTVTFSLASTVATTIFDAATEYRVGGTKVVSARRTGWGVASGTLSRAAYASYAGQTVSNPPTQAEVQQIDDALKLLSRTVAALITDLTTHGLIGP